MIKLTQLLKEIKINQPSDKFEGFLRRIPNSQYFYILDDMDFPAMEGGEVEGDAVDYFYDDLFNKEIKGSKFDYDAVNFDDWKDKDREKHSNHYGMGLNELLLVNKIYDIIKNYYNQ
jgi:hypothetical protein